MVLLLIFFFGTAMGSFLTVVIDRLPREISIIKGRSFCEYCRHTLSWQDLFPLFSYIFLRGRCRYCHKKIGPHYFLLELLAGTVFVLTYLATFSALTNNVADQLFLLLVYRLIVVCALFVIFFIDLKHSIIPLSVLIILVICSFFWNVFFQTAHFLPTLLTAGGSFLFFFGIHAVTRGKGMGFGDVLFAFVIGLLLGFPTTIVALYIAFLTGSLVSLILILGKKKTLKSALPFGPFLVLGTFVCFLWGEQITSAFLMFLRLQ